MHSMFILVNALSDGLFFISDVLPHLAISPWILVKETYTHKPPIMLPSYNYFLFAFSFIFGREL